MTLDQFFTELKQHREKIENVVKVHNDQIESIIAAHQNVIGPTKAAVDFAVEEKNKFLLENIGTKDGDAITIESMVAMYIKLRGLN